MSDYFVSHKHNYVIKIHYYTKQWVDKLEFFKTIINKEGGKIVSMNMFFVT